MVHRSPRRSQAARVKSYREIASLESQSRTLFVWGVLPYVPWTLNQLSLLIADLKCKFMRMKWDYGIQDSFNIWKCIVMPLQPVQKLSWTCPELLSWMAYAALSATTFASQWVFEVISIQLPGGGKGDSTCGIKSHFREFFDSERMTAILSVILLPVNNLIGH